MAGDLPSNMDLPLLFLLRLQVLVTVVTMVNHENAGNILINYGWTVAVALTNSCFIGWMVTIMINNKQLVIVNGSFSCLSLITRIKWTLR